MDKIDKVIKYFRNIKEESPTMSSGGGGFSGLSGSEGPTAGFDPILGMKKRRNGKDVDLRSVDMKFRRWIKYLKNK